MELEDCTCFVCLDVLLDPVTLACGHTLDERCLLRVVATASSDAGQRACPMCRHALPEVLPGVNEQMRNRVQQRQPEQVGSPTPLLRGRCTGAWAKVLIATRRQYNRRSNRTTV